MGLSRSTGMLLLPLLLHGIPSTIAQGSFDWPSYAELEYATPRPITNVTNTYAPPYSSLSVLVANRSTTAWPADPSPTDQDLEFGRAALSSLWEPIPVSSPPFTTTVAPTPIPSDELIKPPPLPGTLGKRSCHRFPDDFQWSFAGAALQIEGALKDEGRGPSIWEDRSRGEYSGVKGGGPPDIAAMNYYLYKQDIARLAAVGVQSYSFSISWPRIVPFGIAGSPINQQAIDHYNDVIDTVLSYGMVPIVTLHHFDSPAIMGTKTSIMAYDHPEFVESFVYYAQTVLAHYSDRVGTWYTFNEPTMDSNVLKNWLSSRHVLLAHSKVVHWYRDAIGGTAKWSLKFDLSDTGFALPLNPSNPSDVEAAERRNQYLVGHFANPLFLGEQVPQVMRDILGSDVPEYTAEELEYINGTADFFAFDIYTATYHSAPAGGYDSCASNRDHPEWPACTVRSNTRGTWQANFHGNVDRVGVPSEHVRAILGYWQHTYPTPGGITIAEFGLPMFHAANMSLEHATSDRAQSNFYIPILKEVLKAIHEDGVHVKGLFGWSYLDNWEWGQYDDRYGVQLYNDTTMERTYKRAIFDYSEFMQEHMRG